MHTYSADLERFIRYGRQVAENLACPARWAGEIRACFPTIHRENGAVFAARQAARRFSADSNVKHRMLDTW